MGELILASPDSYLCTSNLDGNFTKHTKMVVLVFRSPIEDASTCTFSQKVVNAQVAGAAGVIVADQRRDSELIQMSRTQKEIEHGDDSILIPSVFVTTKTGIDLKNILAESREIVSVLISQQNHSSWNIPFITLVSSFGLILALCSSMIICAGMVTRLHHRPDMDAQNRRGNRLQNRVRGHRTTITLDIKVVDALPTVTPELCGEGSCSCAICLEDLRGTSDSVKQLPCYHKFHAHCITEWLTRWKHTCPLCKHPVNSDPGSRLLPSSSFNRSNSTRPLLMQSSIQTRRVIIQPRLSFTEQEARYNYGSTERSSIMHAIIPEVVDERGAAEQRRQSG